MTDFKKLLGFTFLKREHILEKTIYRDDEKKKKISKEKRKEKDKEQNRDRKMPDNIKAVKMITPGVSRQLQKS